MPPTTPALTVGRISDPARLLLDSLEGEAATDPVALAYTEWAAALLGGLGGAASPLSWTTLLAAPGSPGPALWRHWLRAHAGHLSDELYEYAVAVDSLLGPAIA